eukprot:CAMPEP_0116831210 /NCGR_PEP_ID=MMETSP0418-20121206/5210_1 /TAXON_ID=1158023 /ORGANISM="Astrosyne radiata, Strain 13vi08-1A" /LENGTH=88 /DNA_ID=CAMNT_0004460435 /DNA_START=471 /DNA_END=737 /DNA_ORIENTATION=-
MILPPQPEVPKESYDEVDVSSATANSSDPMSGSGIGRPAFPLVGVLKIIAFIPAQLDLLFILEINDSLSLETGYCFSLGAKNSIRLGG